ncbi:MAG: phosphatase PAP2 family protein [Thermodesulfovibrionia bacterium]|nr:phosphatase PAP2 family protein [Thermodesulfovibrionia bacterium]
MRPVDILTFGFLAFLFIITIIFKKQIPNAYLFLTVYLSLATALSLLIHFKKRRDGKILEMIYDFIFPTIVVVFTFDSLGGLIPYINPVTYDELLIKLDYMIFNAHPTVALERFTTPIVTELLQLAYTSYYFLPVILGVALKVKGEKTQFDRGIFLVILCFFLSFIGYILMPAIGPRFTINHLQSTELHGIFLRDIIDSTLNALEGKKMDAFPSGHTAVTLVVLYLAYKFQRVIFWIFLPLVLALLVSTVYLRYHYVVDIIAGILLFVLTIYIGDKFYNKLEKSGREELKI